MSKENHFSSGVLKKKMECDARLARLASPCLLLKLITSISFLLFFYFTSSPAPAVNTLDPHLSLLTFAIQNEGRHTCGFLSSNFLSLVPRGGTRFEFHNRIWFSHCCRGPGWGALKTRVYVNSEVFFHCPYQGIHSRKGLLPQLSRIL